MRVHGRRFLSPRREYCPVHTYSTVHNPTPLACRRYCPTSTLKREDDCLYVWAQEAVNLIFRTCAVAVASLLASLRQSIQADALVGLWCVGRLARSSSGRKVVYLRVCVCARTCACMHTYARALAYMQTRTRTHVIK
jgi:hypothetical protein